MGCSDQHIDLLLDEMRRLPWTILAGEFTDLATPAWQMLLAGAKRRGNAFGNREQFHVGYVDLAKSASPDGCQIHDWEKFQSSWSGNHRRAIRKSLKRAEKSGGVSLERHRDISFDQAAKLIEQIATLEDRSWKGETGTSIYQTPGMLDYFTHQAQLLAESGEIEIDFLKHGDRVIASDLSYVGKRILHSHKIAYDPDYSKIGPGRLLMYLQLESFFAFGEFDRIDTLGVLSEANAKWATSHYTVSRFMLSTGGILGNTAVYGYEKVWPYACQWLGKKIETPEPAKLGSANYLAS